MNEEELRARLIRVLVRPFDIIGRVVWLQLTPLQNEQLPDGRVKRERGYSVATLRGDDDDDDGDGEVEWLGTQPKRARKGPGPEIEVVDVE
jgi:hypothetical protein